MRRDAKESNGAACRKYANYWWNPMIAELRAQAHKALRKVTRERKKNAGNTEPLVNAFKEIRRQLKKEIACSKKTAWAEYCKILESDPWGKPYRTVMKRCKSKGPTNDMPIDMVKAVLQRLFTMGHGSSHYEGREEAETEEEGDIGLSVAISEGDVVDAAGRMNTKMAAGVDGVPGEIAKLIASRRSELVTRTFNGITESGRIPDGWKTARIILLRKPGKDPSLPNAYRPISILPTMSKIWEKCFKRIIERCIGTDPFHRRQYGFRKKRSTVDAITQVMKFANICKQKKVICVMIALDISNAFNSLSWKSIYEEFDKRKLPWKVKRLIGSYLSGRRIIVSNQHGTVEHEVAAGVPQGSILGPFLWNLVYDRLLERLDNMPMVRATAFADDLAIACSVGRSDDASVKVNTMLRIANDWCTSVGLTLAREKTEVMLITSL